MDITQVLVTEVKGLLMRNLGINRINNELWATEGRQIFFCFKEHNISDILSSNCILIKMSLKGINLFHFIKFTNLKSTQVLLPPLLSDFLYSMFTIGCTYQLNNHSLSNQWWCFWSPVDVTCHIVMLFKFGCDWYGLCFDHISRCC